MQLLQLCAACREIKNNDRGQYRKLEASYCIKLLKVSSAKKGWVYPGEYWMVRLERDLSNSCKKGRPWKLKGHWRRSLSVIAGLSSVLWKMCVIAISPPATRCLSTCLQWPLDHSKNPKREAVALPVSVLCLRPHLLLNNKKETKNRTP